VSQLWRRESRDGQVLYRVRHALSETLSAVRDG
jgi:hypothetical protein